MKMNYLIPNKLSYYFTKIGYPTFKDWYKKSVLLEPIYSELEILTNIIDNSNWLEEDLRNETFIKIKNSIVKQIKTSLGKYPEQIYEEWINSIQTYCFQGGIGYKIQYDNTINHRIPHHWCIKPEYYNSVIDIPNNVILSAIICDKSINISKILETQYWCN